jgi:mevalonate kinase
MSIGTRFAGEIIVELGDISVEGVMRMWSGDIEGLGRLMKRDHDLLTMLGVSNRHLSRLVEAALPHSYGAKLTGAGGGGSMIALTDYPEKVAATIKAHGGTPFIVDTGVEGLKWEM